MLTNHSTSLTPPLLGSADPSSRREPAQESAGTALLRGRRPQPLHGRMLSLLVLLITALLSGCVVVVDDEPYGELTVEWTLEGARDGRDCVDFGARRVEILILDAANDEILEIEPRCDDFGMTVDLEPGRYFIDVTLVDRLDRAVSFTRRESARIIEDTELVLLLDFDVLDLL